MFDSKIIKDIEKAEKDIENGDYREFKSSDDLIDFLGLKNTHWWKRKIYYPLYRFYDDYISLTTWYYRLKRFMVFLTKGFDPKDTWSLDYSIAKYTIPRLKYLKEHKHGCPFVDGYEELFMSNDATEEEMKPMYDEWERIMNKMILALELIKKDGDGECLTEEENEQITEGLKLLARYFRNLWD